MVLEIYQVDAFANKVFSGNPAAVCPLEEWLENELMLKIAAENNLSETAFFVHTEQGYHIRWFTPTAEVDLCGHATLASAWVIFNELGEEKKEIELQSRSGILKVKREGKSLQLDFPTQEPVECEAPMELIEAFNFQATKTLKCDDYIVVFEDPASVREASPDLRKLSQIDLRGVAVTAPGKEFDFVCRFFAPKYGIDEDPVTGSAYTQLVPYWSKVLGKNNFKVRQVSQREGELECILEDNRVLIKGEACLYMKGQIFV